VTLQGHPASYKAGLTHDPDSPTFHEAMNGPYCDKYILAMDKEIGALQCTHTWNEQA